MEYPEEFDGMIEYNDLLSGINLLPIPQELIDVCKCVNKCIKRCKCFRNHEHHYCHHGDRKCENDDHWKIHKCKIQEF